MFGWAPPPSSTTMEATRARNHIWPCRRKRPPAPPGPACLAARFGHAYPARRAARAVQAVLVRPVGRPRHPCPAFRRAHPCRCVRRRPEFHPSRAPHPGQEHRRVHSCPARPVLHARNSLAYWRRGRRHCQPDGPIVASYLLFLLAGRR